MKIGQAFKMALRSIGAKKGRTALTMLGIIIGVASVVIMVSVVQGSNRKTMEYYEKLGDNKISVNIYGTMTYVDMGNGVSMGVSSGSTVDASQLLYDFCAKKQKWIKGVTPQGYVSSPILCGVKNTDNIPQGSPNISFGNDQFAVCNNFEIGRGRDISFLDIQHRQQVIVLGAKVSEYLFGYTDPIGEQVTIAGYPFTVIGVYKAKDADSEYSMDNMAVVPESANRILNKNEPITSFVVKARNASSMSRAMSELSAFLTTVAGQDNFNLYSESQGVKELNKQNMMMSLVLGGIAGISLLVGGIGIMNIMLVTVSERTREIGIRKSIGAPRSSILTQFLVESAVVCGAGGLLGILVGVCGSLIAGKMLLKMILFPDSTLALGAFAFSVILGIGWKLAQQVRKTVRRTDTTGEANPLTGLLYCADCGAKMYNHKGKTKSIRENRGIDPVSGLYPYDHYDCSTYTLTFHHSEKECSGHYIRTKDIRALLLETIRTVSAYAITNEAEFIEKVRAASEVRQAQAAKDLKRKLNKDRKRSGELDGLIKKLYESYATEKISEKRFELLSGEYEREQEALEASIAKAQVELDAFEADTTRVDQFLALARKYTDFSVLTTPMIYEFVDKILVHAPDRSTGDRIQEVDIYLKFIGKFDVPLPEPTPEELAEMEKQRKQRAYYRERGRRQREREKQRKLDAKEKTA